VQISSRNAILRCIQAWRAYRDRDAKAA
jgi:hypothetical protein